MLKQRRKFYLNACIALISALILSSCCRDPNAPILDLNGPAFITVVKGEAYIEQGATARDIEDGDLTPSIITEGSINTNTIGTSTIVYSVEDDCGNMAVKERVVIVSYAANSLVDSDISNYMIVTDCGMGNMSDTAYFSLSNKNLFELNVFNFDTTYYKEEVKMSIDGDNLTIPSQTDTAGATIISGTGLFIDDTTIDFTYEIINVGIDTVGCESTATKM